ncbi:MAG: sulfatase family protein [Promethearchaeota archaeon]
MSKKPNIIIFITHDQGQFAGCYNSLQTPNSLKTPNLDKLAKEGVRFTNYFCTAPQCSPSRGSIQTSKYPHQNGLMGLVNRGWTLPETYKTLPMYLKEQGYTTHLIGFQHEAKNPETLGYDTISKRQFELHYSCQELESEYLKFLYKNKHAKKPFFLCIGTPEVHRPFIIFGKPEDPSKVKIPPYLPDTRKVRQDLAEFYGCIYPVDRTIGRLMKWLKNTGLEENTLFIYTTDHGEAFPRAKCTLYDPGIKTLLIMRYPNSNIINNGKIIPGLSSNIDLLPTLIDIIGGGKLENIEGKSLIPLINGSQEEIHEQIFAEISFHEIYNPIRCIRTKRYKYIRNFEPMKNLFQMPKDIISDPAGKEIKKRYKKVRPSEEFYDLELDPLEKMNLIEDPNYSETLTKLKKELEAWMQKTRDPLLKGRIKPQWGVLKNFKKIELFEHIYLPIMSLVQNFLRINFLYKYIRRLLRYI